MDGFLNDVRDVRILVVGDLILDKYIFGSVSRISPEAPVPVVLKSHEKRVLGGAGNVAANVVSLGGSATLVGLTGDDQNQEDFRELCEDVGIDKSGIVTSNRICTISKTRFVSSGNQIIRFDEEEVEALCDESQAEMLARIGSLLPSCQAVVLSDYNKGVFRSGLSLEIIALARAAGKPVIVDPKGSDYSRYAGATTLTPNLKELSEAVGRDVVTDDEVVEAARELIRDHDLDYLIATRSERGISVVEKTSVQHIPTRAREVFDVSGAGDTVIASFALAVAVGLNPQDAAQVANAAAAVAVSKRGTAQVHIEEVRTEMMRQGTFSRTHGAVLDWTEARSAVEHWQSEGLKVGFTNGCFDILHFGHVSALARARRSCDRLVIGLNMDESVRRLKGPDRPINDQHDRSAVLVELRSVDAVVMFREETPLELITKLQPDIIFKGADYTIENVVGREVVEGRGGKVVLLDLEDGRSTTGVVEKISARATG